MDADSDEEHRRIYIQGTRIFSSDLRPNILLVRKEAENAARKSMSANVVGGTKLMHQMSLKNGQEVRRNDDRSCRELICRRMIKYRNCAEMSMENESRVGTKDCEQWMVGRALEKCWLVLG